MSILSDIQTATESLNIPIETGHFSGEAPSKYIVVVPMTSEFFCSDDFPEGDVQTARLAFYCIGNYETDERNIVDALLAAGVTITDRSYIEYEPDTNYNHVQIDVVKNYLWR